MYVVLSSFLKVLTFLKLCMYKTCVCDMKNMKICVGIKELTTEECHGLHPVVTFLITP